MKKITIRSPIWKTMSIGIAEYKITDDIELNISYKNGDGIKLFPQTYVIPRLQALNAPAQYVKGMKLKILEIKDLKEKRDTN